MRKYGSSPVDMGYFFNPNPEMMFWMYCPVSLAGSSEVVIPPNLSDYEYMIWLALKSEPGWEGQYVYLTAKTLHVTPENMGNRHGWHSDGFGTDDINYIWSDKCPTEFLESDQPFDLSSDHILSMSQMNEVEKSGIATVKAYKPGHILRLDPSVIHRVAADGYEGFRSFAKVTISKNKFDLAGNSVNYRLKTNWVYSPRTKERNLESTKC